MSYADSNNVQRHRRTTETGYRGGGGGVDTVDCPNRRISVTMLRCSVDKPECSYAQVMLQERRRKKLR